MRKMFYSLLALVLNFAHTAAFAKSPTTRLVVAVDENDFLPYYQTRADGSFNGFARDLLDRFARDEGYELDYQVYPLNRVQQLQIQGKVDLRFPDSPLWANNRKKVAEIHYSCPVVTYVDGIFRQVTYPSAMNDHRFSILRGFTPLSFLPLIKSGKVHFVEAPDLKAALAMHQKQRVDGVYGNEAVLTRLNREGLGERLEIQSLYPVTRDSYRLSSGTNKLVIERFDRWYSQKKTDIDALLATYQLSAYRP